MTNTDRMADAYTPEQLVTLLRATLREIAEYADERACATDTPHLLHAALGAIAATARRAGAAAQPDQAPADDLAVMYRARRILDTLADIEPDQLGPEHRREAADVARLLATAEQPDQAPPPPGRAADALAALLAPIQHVANAARAAANPREWHGLTPARGTFGLTADQAPADDAKPCTYYEHGGCHGPCTGRHCHANTPQPTPAARVGSDRSQTREGWPPGGIVTDRWRTCARCDDEIGPGEHVYPAHASSARSVVAAGVLCAVCEVKAGRERAEREGPAERIDTAARERCKRCRVGGYDQSPCNCSAVCGYRRCEREGEG